MSIRSFCQVFFTIIYYKSEQILDIKIIIKAEPVMDHSTDYSEKTLGLDSSIL